MNKETELISKLEEIVELYKAYYDSQKSPAVKLIHPQWENNVNKLESEISQLKEQINKEEKWATDRLIDFVNWYLRLCKIITDSDCRFELENQSVIDSFSRGDDYKLWWNKVNPSQTPDSDCGIYEEKQ
jgi:hypothetical protein